MIMLNTLGQQRWRISTTNIAYALRVVTGNSVLRFVIASTLIYRSHNQSEQNKTTTQQLKEKTYTNSTSHKR